MSEHKDKLNQRWEEYYRCKFIASEEKITALQARVEELEKYEDICKNIYYANIAMNPFKIKDQVNRIAAMNWKSEGDE